MAHHTVSLFQCIWPKYRLTYFGIYTKVEELFEMFGKMKMNYFGIFTKVKELFEMFG